MLTDLYTKKQAEIEQKIPGVVAVYPSLWREVVSDWQVEQHDAIWLTYAANYLLHTGSTRWAIDPFSLCTRLKLDIQPDFLADLQELQLVVLTHAHADHLDLNLITALRDLPITWVIPSFMLERVQQAASLPEEKIIIPQPGIPIQFSDLALTPFEALHMRGNNGVPEMGYLAEFNNKRWLFPGDTRVYDPARLPSFGKLNGVFAHLWLGKARALDEPPPLLEAFCDFFIALQPGRIIVTHLEELGRKADDFWTENHYQLVRQRINELEPEIAVTSLMMGQKTCL
jgi:hypothetical protein